MTVWIWSFLPEDMQHLPAQAKVDAALTWLRVAMPAYKVEATDHGRIAFFDCGGNMGATYCSHCGAELGAETWSAWMTEDYDDAAGFEFSHRAMLCCGEIITLDQIQFENPCFFGRFGIAVTDTMKTYSQNEIEGFAAELGKHLGCSIRFLEAHY